MNSQRTRQTSMTEKISLRLKHSSCPGDDDDKFEGKVGAYMS